MTAHEMKSAFIPISPNFKICFLGISYMGYIKNCASTFPAQYKAINAVMAVANPV